MEAKYFNSDWGTDIKAPPAPPTETERAEVLSIINDYWGITPEALTPLLDDLSVLRQESLANYDNYFAGLDLADSQLYKLKTAISGFKSGQYQTIELQIKVNKGKPSQETVTIDHPAHLPGILKMIESFIPPNVKHHKGKPGNPKRFWRNMAIETGLDLCIAHLLRLSGTNTETETDRCYFAGLMLSLAGACPTPSQMNESLEDYRKKKYDDLKRFLIR